MWAMARPNSRLISRRMLLACVVIAVVGSRLDGQGPAREGGRIMELDSESPEVRARASAEILQRREAEIDALMQLLERRLVNDDRQGTVKDVMLVLGKLRASRAVPLLVRHLTYEAFYKNTKRPQTTEDLYPAVSALIEIGSPSLKAVLERVTNESDPTVTRTAAAVIRGVLGERWASSWLKEEAGAERLGDRRRRLEAVAHAIEELP